MPAWVIPAATAAYGLISQAIAKGNDQRQLNQQGKLQALQMQGNKEMMDYQQAKQMEMWNATGYGAQKEMMKGAGLNPALMYGMGGGGGQSMGQATASVTGANAPTGGGEIQGGIGMGIQAGQQMAMMQAQTENLKADTAKKEAEAAKTAGVDTEAVKTGIESLTQGIQNAKAQEQLTKAQTRMQGLQNELMGQTLDDQIETVNYTAKKACQEAQQAVNNTDVSDATIQAKIQIIKQDAIGKLLENAQTKAQTGLIKSQTQQSKAQTANIKEQTEYTKTLKEKAAGIDTEVGKATLSKIAAEIAQGWSGQGLENSKQQLTKHLAERGFDIQETQQIIQGVTGIMSLGKPGSVITNYNEHSHY